MNGEWQLKPITCYLWLLIPCYQPMGWFSDVFAWSHKGISLPAAECQKQNVINHWDWKMTIDKNVFTLVIMNKLFLTLIMANSCQPLLMSNLLNWKQLAIISDRINKSLVLQCWPLVKRCSVDRRRSSPLTIEQICWSCLSTWGNVIIDINNT